MHQTKIYLLFAFGFGFLSGCNYDNETDSSLAISTSVVESDSALAASLAMEDPIYFVARFDPERNAMSDLETTIDIASRSRKRILVEVGGDW